MKDVQRKDLPGVSGGVKPGDYGDCVTPPDLVYPEYPKFPTSPVPIDPDYPAPLDA